MPKPDGMYQIHEIAATCGVSINALRFYEAKNLLKPAYTDSKSGYRYYSRENLHQLRSLLNLKDGGLSLKDIKDYVSGHMDVTSKIDGLIEQQAALQRAIDHLKVWTTLPDQLTVHKMALPERLCLCRTITAKTAVDAIAGISSFYDEIIRSGVKLSREWPEFCEYPDDSLLHGNFPTANFTVTACIPIDEKNSTHETVLYPAQNAVAVDYRGSYFDLHAAYQALMKYIGSHNYSVAGYAQEIYIQIDSDGAVKFDDPSNITRVIVPVKNKT